MQPYGIAVDGSGAVSVADYLGYDVRQGRLAPVLQYSVSGKQLILSWPVGLTGYAAQVSSLLSPTNWLAVTNVPLATNQYFFVTNGIQTGSGFYRLHK
jgi:hypothetical protein